MLKFLALLLLSSIVMPAAFNAKDNSFDTATNEPQEAYNDPDDEEYPYTDFFDGGNNYIRTYETRQMAPVNNKQFCAPSGYVFNVEIKDFQLEFILDEAEKLKFDYLYMNYSLKYVTYGTEVYVDSNGFWDQGGPEGPRAFYIEHLKDSINNNHPELMRVKEVTVQFDISVLLEVTFYTQDSFWYTFKLYGEEMIVEPYDDTSFVAPFVYYFENPSRDERRINVMANLIEGFFCESPYYNKNGFKTDEVEILDWNTIPGTDEKGYYAKKKLTLIANDSVSIGQFDYGSLEITYPSEPLPCKFKLEFTSGGKNYTYYSKTFIVGDPNVTAVIDGAEDRTSIQRGIPYTFSMNIDNFDLTGIYNFAVRSDIYPIRLNDPNYDITLWDKSFPNKGKAGYYYYVPSDREIALHNEKKDAEFMDEPAEGRYYVWNSRKAEYEEYQGVYVARPEYDATVDGEFVFDKYAKGTAVIPFKGRWEINYHFSAFATYNSYHIDNVITDLEVVLGDETEDYIVLKDNMPDEIKLLNNGDSIDIAPTISSYSEDIDYYYDFELAKTGIVDVVMRSDGKMHITPIAPGVVTLTIGAASRLFKRITKDITIRVLDSIYDVSSIYVPDGFHKAGQELTVSLSIRGFSDIQNINVAWTVVDKKENPVREVAINEDGELIIPKDETVFVAHRNATMTIYNPASEDYTITASYEDIELDKITIQVRYVDLNSFLKVHIWWIFLLTMAFVAFVIIILKINNRGKTTVEHIQRVYQVFCQCLSNDTLSIPELKRIKREITRCLHRCEDLNIDALNQYEKATRYLRKSLVDVKTLIIKYDEYSAEEKSILYDRLDKDLAKALNVAREIENAKGLIEQYHNKANRKNFEEIETEKKKGKKE